MKIVNINGRLETQGTWEETDAQAKRQAAGIVQQRTELRAMLSGNVAFHVDPRAAKPVKLVRLCLTDEAEAENTSFYREYGDGNCACHISAPCGSCTHPGNPLNQAEDDTAWVTCVDPARDGSDCTVWTVSQGQTHTAVGGPVRMHNLPKAKPPAVWRTADQIPQSERHGLWFYRPKLVCLPTCAGAAGFHAPGHYLKCLAGTKSGDDYNPNDYQQPVEQATHLAPDTSVPDEETYIVCIKSSRQRYGIGQVLIGAAPTSLNECWLPCDKDGWVSHTPTADSVCPVPDGVKYEVRMSSGDVWCGHGWLWGDSGNPWTTIVAWRPVGVAT